MTFTARKQFSESIEKMPKCKTHQSPPIVGDMIARDPGLIITLKVADTIMDTHQP